MLHGEFFSYNLKEGDNIDAHVLNVENMAHRLSDLGQAIFLKSMHST
jgi:hypothetical protein